MLLLNYILWNFLKQWLLFFCKQSGTLHVEHIQFVLLSWSVLLHNAHRLRVVLTAMWSAFFSLFSDEMNGLCDLLEAGLESFVLSGTLPSLLISISPVTIFVNTFFCSGSVFGGNGESDSSFISRSIVIELCKRELPVKSLNGKY